MITAKAFAGKHYAVYGLARSGLATVEALLASGARVTAWDDGSGAREALCSGEGGGRDHFLSSPFTGEARDGEAGPAGVSARRREREPPPEPRQVARLSPPP